jgi:hypothetical protein
MCRFLFFGLDHDPFFSKASYVQFIPAIILCIQLLGSSVGFCLGTCCKSWRLVFYVWIDYGGNPALASDQHVK